jgi:hypothetical protein
MSFWTFAHLFGFFRILLSRAAHAPREFGALAPEGWFSSSKNIPRRLKPMSFEPRDRHGFSRAFSKQWCFGICAVPAIALVRRSGRESAHASRC